MLLFTTLLAYLAVTYTSQAPRVLQVLLGHFVVRNEGSESKEGNTSTGGWRMS